MGRSLRGIVLGPCPCMGCGTAVYWARGLTRFGWNGPVIPGPLTWRENTGGKHHCRRRMPLSANTDSKRDAGRGRQTPVPPAA